MKHTVKKAVEIIGKENITDIIEPSAGGSGLKYKKCCLNNGIVHKAHWGESKKTLMLKD